MNHQLFKFGIQGVQDTLYTPEKGYGFVIEENRNNQELLQIPELNSGFELWYFLNRENLSALKVSTSGIYTQKTKPVIDNWPVPLHFKVNLPSEGNYTLHLKLKNIGSSSDSAFIFTGRRRLMAYIKDFPVLKEISKTFTINISDIIPRGKTTVYTDRTLDLTIVSNALIALEELEIIPSFNLPTLYIGGDSTVTDQFTSYPYHPGCSYCGWAQMLPSYLTPGICVSNHSHSGLTSHTFRSEGHYAVIQKALKPGDYMMLQFGHNDQKLPELDAYGGYTQALTAYIREIKEQGAQPILVTPLARNTWLANGSYNDLLIQYADACLELSIKEGVPVVDLHKRSKNFILANGLERSKAYFFPNDYTHTNDYGGFQMAGFIANELSSLNLPVSQYIIGFVDEISASFCPPQERVTVPKAPEGFIDQNALSFEVSFTDINHCKASHMIRELTAKGIIPNTEKLFRPDEVITRVEALEWIIKAVGFVPMNVYNDYYPDVIGHEWYAGIVEVAYQNDLVDTYLTRDGYFHPQAAVTGEELISFLIRSYKCRKQLPEAIDKISIEHTSEFAVDSIQAASALGFIDNHFAPDKPLTREHAVPYIYHLAKLLMF